MNKPILKGFFLKFISLLLAIMVWAYVHNEITRSKEAGKVTVIWDKEWNLEIRDLPIKVNIKGSPPTGYNLSESGMTINPARCSVVGKRAVLDNIELIETEPIDVRKFTQTSTLKVYLRPISNVIVTKEEIEVTIPVEKLRR